MSRNIIDLTDDDQDDSLQILSSAASRAEEAASRMANHFESVVLQKHRMYLAHLTHPAHQRRVECLIMLGKLPQQIVYADKRPSMPVIP